LHENVGVSDQLIPKNSSSSTASIRRRTLRLQTRRHSQRFVLALFGVFALIVAAATPVALTSPASAVNARQNSIDSSTLTSHDSTTYSVGTPDPSQPSGVAPPTTSDIPGYQLSYVTNFSGDTLPPGWEAFWGTTVGDPGGQFGGTNHVVVSGNMLQLNTYQDPNYNNEWVTGGVCQCADPYTYGAFFVRSRMTGAGPTQVEMLWPVSGWPPEIDFDETYSGVSASHATFHYTSANLQIHRNLNINMTAWHTWGVIWTPTSLTYTVDGNVWGTVVAPSVMPDQAMALHIQQQTWCSSGYACPTSPQSTDVNWVAEYTSTTAEPFSVGSFGGDSAAISPGMKARIRQLAKVIVDRNDSTVTLTGYANGMMSRTQALAVSSERAIKVKHYLQLQLASLNDLDVSVVALGAGGSADAADTINARVSSGRVVALLQ
jgi:outer membrane protein OmpA-like peptidoglycan-associated protein